MVNEHSPLFSIICATYNRAHVLSRAIESVKYQTFDDWELLIIDDGSTDNTDDVISSYLKDTRIHYSKMEKNRGVGAARNRGVSLSRAGWIVLLDSDNALVPSALAMMSNAIKAMTHIKLHKFCVHSFDEMLMGEQPDNSIEITGVDYLHGRFKGEHHSVVQSDYLKKYRFFESFSGGEGIIWSLIALDVGAIAYHPQVTELYEIEGGDRLSVKSKNHARLMKVFYSDIKLLWLQYLRYAPTQLLVRLGKFSYYAIMRLTHHD